MHEKAKTIKTTDRATGASIETDVIVMLYDSLDEFKSVVAESGGNPKTAALEAVNSLQESRSGSSPQGPFRATIADKGADSAEAKEAEADFQGAVSSFRYGTAAKKSDGLTQVKSQRGVRALKGVTAGMDDGEVLTVAELRELLGADGEGVVI